MIHLEKKNPLFIRVLIVMFIRLVGEAISMADKIIILSKRPSRIKKIIDVKLTDKSTPINNRKAKEFSYYYDLIWKEIDHV